MLRIIQSFLSDRVLLYDTTEGRRTKVLIAGAAQGSVLGPDIWNIDYDSILGLKGLPEGVSLVGYADDLVLVITVKNFEEAQLKLDAAIRHVLSWISVMIRKEENWDACANFVEKVLREKKADEHLVDYSRIRGAR